MAILLSLMGGDESLDLDPDRFAGGAPKGALGDKLQKFVHVGISKKRSMKRRHSLFIRSKYFGAYPDASAAADIRHLAGIKGMINLRSSGMHVSRRSFMPTDNLPPPREFCGFPWAPLWPPGRFQ